MATQKSHEAERQKDIDLSYCRAAFYSALAIGFQPPTEQTLSRLLTADSKASLASAAALLYPERESELRSCIEKLPNAKGHDTASLTCQYRVMFGHTARGQIPPYETEYGNEALFQQPQELGDLMGFYRAFGLTPKQGTHERPDHVSCECEFLMFLALKEAYALEQNDRDMLGETRKAEKLFLRDHLSRFLPAFVSQLTREDPDGFYGALAQLSRSFVEAECGRMKVALGPTNLGLRPADDSNVPMACGNAAECAAMVGGSDAEELE